MEGEAEDDAAAGELAYEPTELASAPRCFVNMLTIGSLSPSRVSSMPKRIAAASMS